MQRITISIDDDLGETFDAMIASRAYASRSEAMRDLLRDTVERWRQDDSSAVHSVANLSYVYDRRVGSLAERLAGLEHASHDLVISSTTLRLDHEHSLVGVVLKGETIKLRDFADRVGSLRGVSLAKLNLIAVRPGDSHHHADAHHHHGHEHQSPMTN